MSGNSNKEIYSVSSPHMNRIVSSEGGLQKEVITPFLLQINTSNQFHPK